MRGLCGRGGLPWWLSGKDPPATAGGLGSIPGWGRSLEREIATHSSILAWETLEGHSPQGSQESDMIKQLNNSKSNMWSGYCNLHQHLNARNFL